MCGETNVRRATARCKANSLDRALVRTPLDARSNRKRRRGVKKNKRRNRTIAQTTTTTTTQNYNKIGNRRGGRRRTAEGKRVKIYWRRRYRYRDPPLSPLPPNFYFSWSANEPASGSLYSFIYFIYTESYCNNVFAMLFSLRPALYLVFVRAALPTLRAALLFALRFRSCDLSLWQSLIQIDCALSYSNAFTWNTQTVLHNELDISRWFRLSKPTCVRRFDWYVISNSNKNLFISFCFLLLLVHVNLKITVEIFKYCFNKRIMRFFWYRHRV